MINRIYRLMDTKRIEMVQREIGFGSGIVLAKPDFMSVCAADLRYYFGRRKREILNKKLPMALIHEATATVLHDSDGRLEKGMKVVLVPLIEKKRRMGVKGNYDPDNPFLSSGYDGFMQDYVALPHNSIITIPGDYTAVYVFSEIVSVVFNALKAFENACVTAKDTFGVWGDGSMGYATSLVLKYIYPKAKIYVFGKTARKLQRFSFADKVFSIDDIPGNLEINHCFECVGGSSSELAIEQIAKLIAPQGCVSLFGVSEEAISINTRMILDKGVQILGNSRSTAEDFQKAVALIYENKMFRRYLEMLISEVIEVKSENDIVGVFEQDSLNDFKTVIKWAI